MDIFQGDSDMDGRWNRTGSGFIEARRGVWVSFLFSVRHSAALTTVMISDDWLNMVSIGIIP